MTSKFAAGRRNRLLQSGRDFVIGLGLYTIIVLAAGHANQNASHQPVPLFSSSAFAAAPHAIWAVSHPIQTEATVFRSTDRREATIILGLAFASMVAFNLALIRHLRRVYASPR